MMQSKPIKLKLEQKKHSSGKKKNTPNLVSLAAGGSSSDLVG